MYKAPRHVLIKTRGGHRAPRAACKDREGRTTGKEKSTKAEKALCTKSMDEVDMRLHDQRSGQNSRFLLPRYNYEHEIYKIV